MATIFISFSVGGLVGLLARPLLDAYLLWRTAERFERLHEDPASAPFEEDIHRPTGV